MEEYSELLEKIEALVNLYTYDLNYARMIKNKCGHWIMNNLGNVVPEYMTYEEIEEMLSEIVDRELQNNILNHFKLDKNTTQDNIRPNHYKLNIKGVECEVMDIIEAVGADKSFYFGNAIKYLLRHQNKNGIEDLKKCRYYIDKMIEEGE